MLAKSLYRIHDKKKVFEMRQERIKAYEKTRKVLIEETLMILKDWKIPLKFYIDSCGDGLGEALHQVQIIDDKPREGPVCYTSREIMKKEARCGEIQIHCLFIVDRYSKTPIFFPCHKDETTMDTDLLLCNRSISNTGLFNNIISDRDPKFTSALYINLQRLFGTKLSFSTAYNPQPDGMED
ncbi:hypothetical protein O181_092373 [Austropuccinia psidii MF-1]|uniref:Integrase catalytic domain-containing protein n=1 Tax=Austropuccinia psidii MF-1 TaxID=1389203 RepID=A0A9Q3IZ54_9BASI|nr:hypothetical protein [Austropuccinia psidii MF-1]